jgi:m7GpppX diphosphatase
MRYEGNGNEARGMASALEPRRSRHFICFPEQYYHKAMQHVISANRRHRDQAWIFNLINGTAKHDREVIYIDTEHWLLCSHPESDARFLVVFKDLRLHSIRDLRHEHVPMLRDVNRQVAAFLRGRFSRDVRDFKFFFHYMPSVFQLHMHVCLQHTGDTLRIHSLQSVLYRLKIDDLWFQRALILCPVRRVFGHLYFDSSECKLH